jgi:hypothetical protein
MVTAPSYTTPRGMICIKHPGPGCAPLATGPSA